MEAMETMESEEGARDGGLDPGEMESDLSGVLGELILNWERSVGLEGVGREEIMVEPFMLSSLAWHESFSNCRFKLL